MRSIARLLHEKWTQLTIGDFSPAHAIEPHITYAGLAPARPHISSGGFKKLAVLAEKFPEAGKKANILYLVSSALPRSALAWAKRAKQCGLKVVLNQNGVAFGAWASRAELERINSRNRLLLENADAVVYQSHFCRNACDIFVSKYQGPSKVIYNPVPTCSRLSRRPFGKILVMGSHSQKERVTLALEVVELARRKSLEYSLVVLGPLKWSGATDWAASVMKKMPGSVQFVGSYNDQQADLALEQAYVLLHLQDKDASPTVPLQAIAKGVPVIGLDSGGMPELVTPGEGCLLPVPQGWGQYYYPSADAILKAIQETDSLQVRLQERFTESMFLQQHKALFEAIRGRL